MNIRKITTGQRDDYRTLYLLDYLKNYYKMIAIDMSKQQELYSDPKENQQINFTGKKIEMEIHKYFSVLKKQKKSF